MRYSKRHAEILRIVSEEGTVAISGLADRLGVSLETIRRDVQPLADAGTLVKMHGAVTQPHAVGEAPFERRMRENAEGKRAIARRLAECIADGDTLMLDHGATTSVVARALLRKRNLTVITNSADIARTLATVNGNTVFMAGGQLRGDNGAALGTAAIEFLRRFKVRHAIVTAGAVDAVAGPMDFDLQEADLARAVLEAGEIRTLVADQSKFGRRALVTIGPFDLFDQIVTDAEPPPDLAAALAAGGVEVLLPDED
jgi:DeoR family glycerol-3-phosphate regulon repressor